MFVCVSQRLTIGVRKTIFRRPGACFTKCYVETIQNLILRSFLNVRTMLKISGSSNALHEVAIFCKCNEVEVKMTKSYTCTLFRPIPCLCQNFNLYKRESYSCEHHVSVGTDRCVHSRTFLRQNLLCILWAKECSCLCLDCRVWISRLHLWIVCPWITVYMNLSCGFVDRVRGSLACICRFWYGLYFIEKLSRLTLKRSQNAWSTVEPPLLKKVSLLI